REGRPARTGGRSLADRPPGRPDGGDRSAKCGPAARRTTPSGPGRRLGWARLDALVHQGRNLAPIRAVAVPSPDRRSRPVAAPIRVHTAPAPSDGDVAAGL